MVQPTSTNIPLAARDWSGQQFGRLTAIRNNGLRDGCRMWIFKCECGTEKSMPLYPVLKGVVLSCGCYHRERIRTHGHAGKHPSRTWRTWDGMIARCYRPISISYPNYGGRGITVCERWKKFENFLEDMGVRPSGKSLDRIDSNGPYEPNNCRWMSAYEQAQNRRTTTYITYCGVRCATSDWNGLFDLGRNLLLRRIHSGWSIEQGFGIAPPPPPSKSWHKWIASQDWYCHGETQQKFYDKGYHW